MILLSAIIFSSWSRFKSLTGCSLPMTVCVVRSDHRRNQRDKESKITKPRLELVSAPSSERRLAVALEWLRTKKHFFFPSQTLIYWKQLWLAATTRWMINTPAAIYVLSFASLLVCVGTCSCCSKIYTSVLAATKPLPHLSIPPP